MSRLFFALWPDDAVRARLDAARRALTVPGRPVPARNLHLTLVFLGDVAAAPVEALDIRAATAGIAPFALTLDRFGSFPRARVAWLAPSTPPPVLLRLADAIATACRAAGLTPDTRPYQPHLTIARSTDAVADAAIAPQAWPVSDFCLVESARDADGSAYTVRARWPLISG